jgi:ribosome-associated translation inhibitor RaiA
MNKEVLFRDFEGLLHHYQFIDMQIGKTIGKFEGLRPSHVRVTIDEVARKAFRPHDFGCEIILHHPNMRKTILTHKFSKDFYKSVRAACNAAEKALLRNSKNRLARQRKFDSVFRDGTQF